MTTPTAVKAQLAAGADVNAPDNAGTSALLWAAYNASPDLVAVLLAAGADPNAPNPFGVTPLLQATRNGDAATTRLLLDAGADVGRAVREGETPLMAAARTGNLDSVQLLLERGADVNATEALQNQTALMWAVGRKSRARGRRAARCRRRSERPSTSLRAEATQHAGGFPDGRIDGAHVGGA